MITWRFFTASEIALTPTTSRFPVRVATIESLLAGDNNNPAIFYVEL
jgi:hypothetical protein